MKMPRSKWTNEEIQYLMENYKPNTYGCCKNISKHLNKSIPQVQYMARKLKLTERKIKTKKNEKGIKRFETLMLQVIKTMVKKQKKIRPDVFREELRPMIENYNKKIAKRGDVNG